MSEACTVVLSCFPPSLPLRRGRDGDYLVVNCVRQDSVMSVTKNVFMLSCQPHEWPFDSCVEGCLSSLASFKESFSLLLWYNVSSLSHLTGLTSVCRQEITLPVLSYQL